MRSRNHAGKIDLKNMRSPCPLTFLFLGGRKSKIPLFSFGQEGSWWGGRRRGMPAQGVYTNSCKRGLYTCLLMKFMLKLVSCIHTTLWMRIQVWAETFKEPPIPEVKTIKIETRSHPEPKWRKNSQWEECLTPKKSLQQNPLCNWQSRIFQAASVSRSSTLQPLLNQLQWGQLTVPAGPDVPTCTCSHRRFWLCSSWGVSPQRPELCEISAY